MTSEYIRPISKISDYIRRILRTFFRLDFVFFFNSLQNTWGEFQILNTQPLKTLGLISEKWPHKYNRPISKISDYSRGILRTFLRLDFFCFLLVFLNFLCFFYFNFLFLHFFISFRDARRATRDTRRATRWWNLKVIKKHRVGTLWLLARSSPPKKIYTNSRSSAPGGCYVII